MHVHSPKNKNRSITFIVWVLGRVKKCQKNVKIFIFVLNICQSVTHVSTFILKYRSVALKKKIHFYLFKAKKIHGDSVKNESARAKI